MRAYLILPPLRIHMCRLDVRDDVEGGQDTGFVNLAEAAGDEVDLLVESGEGRRLDICWSVVAGGKGSKQVSSG